MRDMATVSESDILSFECTDALDDEGYVLTLGSNGKVSKCPAGGKVFGVALTSTKDPVTGVAQANKQVAVVQAPKYAYVQYQNGSGETISIGDLVSVKGANAAGKVKKHVSTSWPATYSATVAEGISDENAMIVGIALEDKAQSTSGKLLVKLLCPLPVKQ